MKIVEDKKIIDRLNKVYCASRQGRRLRGIETVEKSWYYNHEVNRYQLFKIVNGQPVQAPILVFSPDEI